MLEPSVTIDSSGLARGIQAATAYSKRTVPQIVNTSAYWISINAKNDLPFVTPEKIDTELATIASPVIGKRGKPLKNKKTFSGGMSALQRSSEAPLAALIVMARARPDSLYNRLTQRRYMLARNPFQGVSREAGRMAMRALIDAMIKQRRRSGKFLVAGWIPAIRKLKAHAMQKFMKGAVTSLGNNAYYGADLGDASPAKDGSLEASATIQNAVGTEGQNAASFNRALILYGLPALQRAVDREGEQQMAYALKKLEQGLIEETRKDWA